MHAARASSSRRDRDAPQHGTAVSTYAGRQSAALRFSAQAIPWLPWKISKPRLQFGSMSKEIGAVCAGLACSESQLWTVNHLGFISLHLMIAANQYESQPPVEMRSDLNILK
jgi:hypothetical protein